MGWSLTGSVELNKLIKSTKFGLRVELEVATSCLVEFLRRICVSHQLLECYAGVEKEDIVRIARAITSFVHTIM